uniref:KIB1-4 beta-propeller domain-containing protein n=1 Tax=Ananas comosus var. bracteatus TaxID=296719 RepID=A0A6V7PDM6_ANACO|nr:unnamed protein product [Ananas comosus var. bracteatus]
MTDLAFHGGLCFAAVRGRYVAVFDFGASPAFQRLLDIRDNDGNYNSPASYAGFLVESEGELLLVKRLGETTAARISIYKLPPIEGDGAIVPVPKDGLRSRALFLGTGNSVSVAARDFSQFVRGNKVYFTDVCCEPGDDRAVFVGRVFESDVAQGSTRRAFGVVERARREHVVASEAGLGYAEFAQERSTSTKRFISHNNTSIFDSPLKICS